MLEIVIVGLAAAIILYAVCFYVLFFFVSVRSALLWAAGLTGLLLTAGFYAAVKLVEGSNASGRPVRCYAPPSCAAQTSTRKK